MIIALRDRLALVLGQLGTKNPDPAVVETVTAVGHLLQGCTGDFYKKPEKKEPKAAAVPIKTAVQAKQAPKPHAAPIIPKADPAPPPIKVETPEARQEREGREEEAAAEKVKAMAKAAIIEADRSAAAKFEAQKGAQEAAAATMSMHSRLMEAEAKASKGKYIKLITVERLLEETELTHLARKFEDADVDDLCLRSVIGAINEDKEEGTMELDAMLDRLNIGGGANARVKRFFFNPAGGKKEPPGAKGGSKSGKGAGGGKCGKAADNGKKKKDGDADEAKKPHLEKKKCPACGKKSTGVGTKKGCQNCKDIMLGKGKK